MRIPAPQPSLLCPHTLTSVCIIDSQEHSLNDQVPLPFEEDIKPAFLCAVGIPLTVPNTFLRLASVGSPLLQPCKDSHWEASSPTRSQHSSSRAQGWRLNCALGNHIDLVSPERDRGVGEGARPPSVLFPKILLFI